MKISKDKELQPISFCLGSIINSLESARLGEECSTVADYLNHGMENAISTLSLAEIMNIAGTRTSKIRQVRKLIHEARKDIPICCNDNGYWLPEYDSNGILTEQGAIDVVMHYSKSLKTRQSLFEITQAEHKALEAYNNKFNYQMSLFPTEGSLL